ncbi:hypothetical protein [Streptomyces sp. cg36]|uniref:hypothetical protein n=1 Tax=Streptomyces sp. cg36 TaxID=3238798 RepID=UPI0034E29D2E
MPEPLTPNDIHRFIERLRSGEDQADAADALGLGPRAVYAAARTDTSLLLALGGNDPYAMGAAGMAARAEYLRLLALGLTPTVAENVLFDGTARVGGCRAQDASFAAACDAVTASVGVRQTVKRYSKFTPERVKVFLDTLRRQGKVGPASAAAGVTNAAVYQKRRRDPGFAAAMDEARSAAAAPDKPKARGPQ